MTNSLGSGIADLNTKRQRRTRQPLPSRHPVSKVDAPTPPSESAAQTPQPTAPAEDTIDTPSSTPAAPRPTIADDTPQREPAAAAAALSAATVSLPALDVNLADPVAHMVSPTQLSIPASIVARFDHARANASSHTSLVIDALRAHADALPHLVLSRRPGPREGDLFPFRAVSAAAAAETPLPLRIRPTRGELDVMKKLVDWVNVCIAQQRPGSKPTNRSEMVAAALDAYLPADD
jgi:hypothetical protein